MSAGIDTHGGKDRRCHVETICSRRWTRQEIKVNRDDLFSDIVCRQCRFNVRENAFWMRSKNRLALSLCYRASSFVSEFDVEYLIIARWFYSWINVDKLWYSSVENIWKNTFHVLDFIEDIFRDFNLKDEVLMILCLISDGYWKYREGNLRLINPSRGMIKRESFLNIDYC